MALSNLPTLDRATLSKIFGGDMRAVMQFEQYIKFLAQTTPDTLNQLTDGVTAAQAAADAAQFDVDAVEAEPILTAVAAEIFPNGRVLNGGDGVSISLAVAGLATIFVDVLTALGAEIIPVANGGTGAAAASDARANLGLAIGTDVQAFNLNLSAISGLSTAADKLTYWTGAGAAALADLTSYGRSLIATASAATARTALGVTATGADTTYAYRANNLSDLTNPATARTNLGLGTASTVNTGTSGATVPLLNGVNTFSNSQRINVAAGGDGLIIGNNTSGKFWDVFPNGSTPGTDCLGFFSSQLGATVLILNGDGSATFTNAAGWRSGLGLGSIATQAASSVAITGGAIDGVAIGAATPAAGTFARVRTPATTVASLPTAAAAGAGARAFVTDATSASFSAAVVGGGANKVPVWSDGAGWFVG